MQLFALQACTSGQTKYIVVVVVVVVVAQGITGVNIERGLKASNEGQSTHHMGGATGSFSVRFHIMMSYGLPSL